MGIVRRLKRSYGRYGAVFVLLLLVVIGAGCIGGGSKSAGSGGHGSGTVTSSTNQPHPTSALTSTSTTASASVTSSSSASKPKPGLADWYDYVNASVVYASKGYEAIARHYFPNAVIKPLYEYKSGIAIASPQDASEALQGGYLSILKEPYFGYTLYIRGYHFVGADKGVLAFYRSYYGYRLVITGTGKAGVGAAAAFAGLLKEGKVNLSVYAMVSYGDFQAVPLKEIGDDNWDGIQENGELIKIYQLYYDEPFQYYWRMVDGDNVTVSGAFIRLVNGSTVYVHALGFNVSVNVRGAKRNITYVIENINPEVMRLTNGARVKILAKGDTFIKLVSSGSFSLVAKNVSNYTIIAFGDHRPRHGTQPPAVFIKIMHDINNESGLFVIDGGDLVYSGKVDQWAALMRVWKWNKPIFVAPGNHEYRGEGINIFHRFFGPVDYAFSLGGYRYIIMNDVQHGYSLTEEQFSWLEEQMKEAKANGERPIVIMHAPPYNPIPGGDDHAISEASAKRLLKLMREYDAFGIFSHIHMNWKGTYEGVPFIITGGGGAPLYAPPNEGGYHGYAVLTMGANGNISVRFVKVD
ncbi:MAG: phosphoesterase [Thermococci archaeon]|nr:phosphoesterase [Thermococci archaeon]